MNDEINIDDFEQFLKTQADKHRMYPDDQVWRNINQQLHGNSRWPALTFAAILTGALVTAGLIFLHPNKTLFDLSGTSKLLETPAKTILADNGAIKTKATKNLNPPDAKTAIYTLNYPAVQETFPREFITPVQEPAALQVLLLPAIYNNKIDISHNVVSSGVNTRADEINPVNNVFAAGNSTSLPPLPKAEPDNTEVPLLAAETGNADITMEQPMDDDETGYFNAQNIITKKPQKPFSIHIYGGSNISYRLLSESIAGDDHFIYNNAINSDPRAGVNNVVKQRPSVGFELGSAISYAVNDRFGVRAGLQFNYRQYNIDAFTGAMAPSVIVLENSGNTDSVRTFSTVHNGSGSRPTMISNHYYQLALPVGIDWKIAKSPKAYLTVGASVQPTYQLNTNMYMITSDYKSYTQQPDLVRRWNLNASAELMANFKIGNIQWQFGPQLRYQMMPTQLKSFSIHENLIDYGLKVGIIKQLK